MIGDKWKLRLVNLLLAVFFLIVAVSGSMLVLKVTESKQHGLQMESLAAYAEQVDEDEVPRELPLSAKELRAARRKRLESYQELRWKNADLAGWIQVEGTAIDYPVMQTPDRPNYYLTHDFNKKESSHGVPYLAESCDTDGGGNNMIVYGHHMKDGSMFADLMKYADQSYYEEHPVIRFDTLTDVGDYQVIGVVEVAAIQEEETFYQNMQALNRFDYSNYVAEVKRRSFYETGEIAAYGEQLLTLITCEYSIEAGRLLVVAKKLAE